MVWVEVICCRGERSEVSHGGVESIYMGGLWIGVYFAGLQGLDQCIVEYLRL